MEAKYYTPEIEEFHVGFEYEYFIMDEWYPVAYHPSDMAGVDKLFARLHSDKIRVKYLDREDIESLNWELDCVIEKEAFYIHKTSSLNNGDIRLVFRDNEHSVQIECEKTGENCYLKVKNKSELRKLMKQLNIE